MTQQEFLRSTLEALKVTPAQLCARLTVPSAVFDRWMSEQEDHLEMPQTAWRHLGELLREAERSALPGFAKQSAKNPSNTTLAVDTLDRHEDGESNFES